MAALDQTLRFIQVFALGTWVGAGLFLSFAVAPGAFAVLAAREQAGAIVGMALGRLHLYGLAAGAIYIAAALLLEPRPAVLLRPAAVLVVVMLLLTLVSQYGVTPRMAELRAEMAAAHGSIDQTPAEHPLRQRFGRLHGVSSALELVILLAGVAALYLTVRHISR
jgi:uncharacterized membrane protein